MPDDIELQARLNALTTRQTNVDTAQTARNSQNRAQIAIGIAQIAGQARTLTELIRVGTVVSVNFNTGACTFGALTYGSIASATTAGKIAGTAPRLVSGGALLEPAATNVLLQNMTVANSYWTKTGTTAPTVTDAGGTTVNLNGTSANLSVFAEGTGTNSWGINRTTSTPVLAASSTYRVSVVFKRRAGKDRDFTMSCITNSVASRVGFNLDTSTITFAGTEFSNGHIVNLGSGLYRLDALLQRTSFSGGNTQFFFRPMANGNTTLPAGNYAGATDNGCEWGYFQCELVTGSALPSSPIVTTSATVTRPADAVQIYLPTGLGNFATKLTFDDASVINYSGVVGGMYTIPLTGIALGRKLVKFEGII